MPAAQPRLRKDAELNRRRIIAAAREVFRDRGVAATLNDVAHHAGVGVGTVYRRFPDKEALIDALFESMVETVETATAEALNEPDAWAGLAACLEKVCEVQAMDRGLREVMLGTGNGPQRQTQMRDRAVPLLEQLVARAKEQGGLRPDVLPADFAIIQLMLGAITEHVGEPGLWRRYLALLLDGMRAHAGLAPLPMGSPVEHWGSNDLVTKSEQDASRRSAGP